MRDIFNFSGRISKKNYLKYISLLLILLIIIFLLKIYIPKEIIFIFSTVIFCFLGPLTVRRLHDIGVSGHWLWITPCLGFIGYFDWIAFGSVTGSALIFLVFHAWLLFLLMKEGDRHSNEFGRPNY